MDPIPSTPGESVRARAILIAVAAIGTVFFLGEVRGGRVIRGADGHGYYAWLRSALLDGDWDFDNEWDAFAGPRQGVSFPNVRTRIGRRANQYSVGPAIAWAGPVLATHAAVRLTGVADADGYSGPYHLAVGTTTFAGFLLTVAFTYRIARRVATPVPAAIATAALVLATPVVAYGTVEVGMAHGPATTALAGYLFVWAKTSGRRTLPNWFGLGLLLGVAALMRWQLLTFSCLLAFDAIRIVPARRFSPRFVVGLSLAATGTVLAFLPQLFAWSRVYGNPFGGTHATAANWLSPSLFVVLLSPDRSLFAWSPVVLVSLVAGVLAGRERAVTGPLFLAVAIQAYVVAAVWGPGVFLGWSFGFRLLTECGVPAVVGLAAFLNRPGPPRLRAAAAVLGVLIAANLLLLQAYRLVAFGESVSGFAQTMAAMGKGMTKRPIEGLVILTLAVVLTTIMFRAVGSQNENRGARPHGLWRSVLRPSPVT